MLKSRLCDNSDAYILAKGNIAISRRGPDQAESQADKRDKKLIHKNCAPFTDCISEINTTQVDNAKYLDVVMPMDNLIELSNIYSKTSRSL